MLPAQPVRDHARRGRPRHLFLGVGDEILQRDDAAFELGVSDDDAQPGADGVGAPELALQRLAARPSTSATRAELPHLAREAERQPRRALADRREEAERRRLGLGFRHREQHALEAHGKADRRHLRAAELAHHAVVAAAADERVLGAELAGARRDLEQVRV